MTTAEETSGSKERSHDEKPANWFVTQTKAVKEYKAFCEMDEQTLEMYTAYRLPTPPKDEPFTEEYPDPATNPLLIEMREAAEAARTGGIILQIRNLLISLLIGLGVYLLGGGVWLLIAIGTFAVLDQIITAMLLWGDRIAFTKSYAYVESLAFPDPESGITQTWWNFERWQKWALARYDFESKKELIGALMHEAFTIVRTGPMTGLIVSNTTGEEWKRKPVNV